MKSREKLLKLLIEELLSNMDSGSWRNKKGEFYNEFLGDSSAILAGVLNALLGDETISWDSDAKWLDDCLITRLFLEDDDVLRLRGVVIWGKRNTTEQWVDSFAFEVQPLHTNVGKRRFRFWFCDKSDTKRTYEEFKQRSPYTFSNIPEWKYKFVLDI